MASKDEQKKRVAELLAELGLMPDPAGQVTITTTKDRAVSSITVASVIR